MFIPFANDGGTYGYEYLGYPMDGISAHSAVDNAVNPDAASDAETFYLPGPPLLDDGRINSWPSGIPTYTHDLQVNTEPACIWHTDEWSSTLLLESLMTSTHDGEFPVARPSEMTDCVAFTYFSLSTFGESESFGQAPVALNEAPTSIDPADVCTRCYEGVSVTLDQSPYTCVGTTASLSGSSSTVSEISHIPAVVQHQEQRASRAKTRSIIKTGKGLTAVSSRSSRRPVGIHGAPKGPYSCCVQGCKKKDKQYKHLSGLRRHYQDKHCEPSPCMHCDRDVFVWTRPYQLKNHLEKQHPDADHNATLVEAKRTRRRATI